MLGLLQRRADRTEGAVSADISGSVTDSQLAIGHHIVQNNLAAGAIVNQIMPGAQPRGPHARRRPVSVLPRRAPRLFGRATELEFAAAALASGEPLQIFGRAGLGKTALLRHIAYGPHDAFPDGVVYYRSRHESLDDLLLRIFEFLFQYESPVKPTAAELATHLVDARALFLLDDVELEREDLETLLTTAPQSVFVLGSPERSLWSDGHAVGLRGLDDDAALALVEQQLERPLVGEERADIAALCRALDGAPLQIVKAAAQIRAHGSLPSRIVIPRPSSAAAPRADAARSLTELIAGDLSAEGRDALALLAALDGAPLHVDDVAALTGRSDSATLLADLERRGLAQSHGPRYAATAPRSALQPAEALARWRAELLSYFVARTERHATQPDDLEPIIQTLRHSGPAARPGDVLRLAHAAEGAAAGTGLWDAWRTILQIALDAAHRAGDQEQEAWALHQLGTRALCLDDEQEARRQLGEALQLRVWTGDEAAAAVTRHNIGHLPGGPPVPPSGPSGAPPWIAPVCVSVVAALGVGTIVPNTGQGDPPNRGDSALHGFSAPQQKRPAAPDRPRPVPAPMRRDRSGDGRRQAARQRARMARLSAMARLQAGAGPARVGTDPRPPEQPWEAPPNGGSTDRIDELAPPVTPPPPPPDAPPPPPQPCRPPGLLAIIQQLLRDELVVVRELLEIDVPGVVYAQVEAVRNLLLGLGHHCTHTETAALVRAAR